MDAELKKRHQELEAGYLKMLGYKDTNEEREALYQRALDKTRRNGSAPEERP